MSLEKGSIAYTKRLINGRRPKFETAKEIYDEFIKYLESLKTTDPEGEHSPPTVRDFAGHCGMTINRLSTVHQNKQIKDTPEQLKEAMNFVKDQITTIQVKRALTGKYKENLVARLNKIGDRIDNPDAAQISLNTTIAEIYLTPDQEKEVDSE